VGWGWAYHLMLLQAEVFSLTLDLKKLLLGSTAACCPLLPFVPLSLNRLALPQLSSSLNSNLWLMCPPLALPWRQLQEMMRPWDLCW
jgi:hypothetical protein